jgi:molybdopterin-biosynthesis enzyme MoeA-like protein
VIHLFRATETNWLILSQPESSIAPYLDSLQKRLRSEDIQVGSYPRWGGGVSVSLVGRDHLRVREIVEEVERELQGSISAEPT